jgi:hypothetical protein
MLGEIWEIVNGSIWEVTVLYNAKLEIPSDFLTLYIVEFKALMPGAAEPRPSGGAACWSSWSAAWNPLVGAHS